MASILSCSGQVATSVCKWGGGGANASTLDELASTMDQVGATVSLTPSASFNGICDRQ